jgi:hypothetical protein
MLYVVHHGENVNIVMVERSDKSVSHIQNKLRFFQVINT